MHARPVAATVGLLLIASLAIAPRMASAQAKAIPAEDFARHPEVNEVSMSPDGKYLAIAVPSSDGMETQLHVVPLSGLGKVQALRFGRQQHVTDLVWTAEDQIVVARAKMEPLKARPYSLGELISTDIAGKHQDLLFGYVEDDGIRTGRRRDEGFAQIVKILDNEPGMVLVDLTSWRTRSNEDMPTAIFRVDTRTGARHEIERSEKAASYLFDQHGRARVMVLRDDDDNPVLRYRATPASSWTPMPATLAGYSLDTLRFENDNNTAYALISDHGEPRQLYKLDFAHGTRTRLGGREDMDIGHLLYAGRDGAPFGMIYDAGKPEVQYLDQTSLWKDLHIGLLKTFPGQMVDLDDFSHDNRKVLFRVWSDRNPGAYYVLDRDASKIQLVNELMPWIKPDSLAPSRVIGFVSRDGVALSGLYTAATGASGPQPLVVMPHGGPYGIYDSWNYDADAQFLANHGYAVLQVNFRGSGGRGINFQRSGFHEWGGKMMDDIADAVRWTTNNNLVDPSRICTYGASFGGYAALMNPIRYPKMYRCAVGYVGVYDLPLMREKGDIHETATGRNYLDRVLGTDMQSLIANSPARNADKIGVPVLLIQGRIDRRVPIDQFDAMETAFRKAGIPVETMVVEGEGHGFYKPENRAALYHRLLAFLDSHIGPPKP